MTLLLISKASFPIRTGTSPSNWYRLFALVLGVLLLKPTRLCHQRGKSTQHVKTDSPTNKGQGNGYTTKNNNRCDSTDEVILFRIEFIGMT